MAQLDLYVRNLWRYGARSVVLQSGANVLLRLPAGDRNAAQQTSHANLVALVEEVAGEAALGALRRGQAAEFAYTLGSRAVRVRATPRSGAWRVEIVPDEAKATVPPPAAAVAAAVAAAGTPIALEALPPTGPVNTRTPIEVPVEVTPRPMVVPPPRAAIVQGLEAPAENSGRPLMDRLLRRLRDMRGSDLHLTTGAPPSARVDGDIRVIDGERPLSADVLLGAVHAIAPEQNRADFEERNDTDFAYDLPGVARFRVNIFRDRKGPGVVIRIIPFQLRKAAELGLSAEVVALSELHKGLVLVTGPTGSGKSTTLAALIDHVNDTRSDHIITIEDPIEFVHESKRCLVHQREVHTHTRSFRDALRAALREDPDVLLVGELRDLETMAMAVETAETGHLVFGTLHTSTAASTVDRMIDQFPADRQEQIRQMLSESLRGVIAQTLCKKIGGGRVAAYEVLFNTNAVANLIRDRKTFQIPSVMQTARGIGMVTLNDSLLDLVRRKQVDPAEAINRSQAKNELRQTLSREGFKIEAAA